MTEEVSVVVFVLFVSFFGFFQTEGFFSNASVHNPGAGNLPETS